MNTKFTLDDKIVTDSLVATSTYASRDGFQKSAVIGGIALQMYAQQALPQYKRPTHDLDLIIIPHLTAEGFRRGIGQEMVSLLPQYHPKVNILRYVNEVKLTDPEEIPFFIHSPKWTERGYERKAKTLERQISNANRLLVPNTAYEVPMVRPEDIAADKTRRLLDLDMRGELSLQKGAAYRAVRKGNLGILAEGDLETEHQTIQQKKNLLPSAYDRGELEFRQALADFRASKDLFDLSLIAKLAATHAIGFDEKYFSQALEETCK